MIEIPFIYILSSIYIITGLFMFYGIYKYIKRQEMSLGLFFFCVMCGVIFCVLVLVLIGFFIGQFVRIT